MKTSEKLRLYKIRNTSLKLSRLDKVFIVRQIKQRVEKFDYSHYTCPIVQNLFGTKARKWYEDEILGCPFLEVWDYASVSIKNFSKLLPPETDDEYVTRTNANRIMFLEYLEEKYGKR